MKQTRLDRPRNAQNFFVVCLCSPRWPGFGVGVCYRLTLVKLCWPVAARSLPSSLVLVASLAVESAVQVWRKFGTSLATNLYKFCLKNLPRKSSEIITDYRRHLQSRQSRQSRCTVPWP